MGFELHRMLMFVDLPALGRPPVTTRMTKSLNEFFTKISPPGSRASVHPTRPKNSGVAHDSEAET